MGLVSTACGFLRCTIVKVPRRGSLCESGPSKSARRRSWASTLAVLRGPAPAPAMGLRYPRVSGPRMRTILLLCLPVAALVAFVAIVFVLDLPDLATQRCCFAAGGFLGSLGAGGVLAGHARGTPKMRRHPQPLVAYRSLADLYVSLHFFVFSLVDYRVRNRCNPLTAALLETFVISGELWSVCSAVWNSTTGLGGDQT